MPDTTASKTASPLAVALECTARLALVECAEGLAAHPGEALGLDMPQLWILAGHVMPSSAQALFAACAVALPALDSEEQALRELLNAECALEGPLGAIISAITARRAMMSDHLWQDMGLPERPALSALIAACWPRLHAGNSQNMRWKRFFYRALCEAEGFALCSVPNCRDCAEYDTCFGEESGESAFVRRVVQAENNAAL